MSRYDTNMRVLTIATLAMMAGILVLIATKEPTQRPTGYVDASAGQAKFVRDCSNNEADVIPTCKCVFTALSRAYDYEWWNDKALRARVAENGYNNAEVESIKNTCLLKKG